MKIKYRYISEYLPVDIEKLRPNSSYKKLIDKRSYPIDTLISKYGKIPEDLLITRTCPNCESKNYKNEVFKDHLWIVKCEDCSLVYTNPIFDENHYNEIYESNNYQEIVKELGESSHAYRVHRFGEERVKDLSKFLNSDNNSVRLLDVGCSTGFFVEAAKNNGWEAKGIDLNPSAIEFGKKRGLNLDKVNLFDLEKSAKFDIITLFDVLEHLVDPAAIINKVSEFLNNKGLISIYVPNYDSASRVLMEENAHFIWPSHHLTYFNIQSISDFLTKRGFKILEIKTEGLDIFDFMWWENNINSRNIDFLNEIANDLQFFINAGGYGKNLRVIAQYEG